MLTQDKYLELLKDAIMILGKKWTAEILWYLMQKPLQFSEIGNLAKGISSKMLTQRLKDLQEYGLVTKIILKMNPLKVSYALSDNAKTINILFYELSVFSLYKMGSGLSRVRAFALAKIRKDLRNFYLDTSH